jgi:AcrR family transcriptional regulator
MPHEIPTTQTAEAHLGPPASRHERRDAATNRQQVLEAAVGLFTTRGVEAVTMAEIARVAGVGKGTLYRRYPDKGQLMLALMDQCVRHLQDEVAAERCRVAASLPALSQVEALIDRLIGWTEEHTAWLGVISDQAAGERRGAVHCGPLYGWMHAVLVGLLERAVAEGEAAIDDCVYVADALLAALDVDLYLFQRRQRGYTPEQISRGLKQLVSGLRTRTSG